MAPIRSVVLTALPTVTVGSVPAGTDQQQSLQQPSGQQGSIGHLPSSWVPSAHNGPPRSELGEAGVDLLAGARASPLLDHRRLSMEQPDTHIDRCQ